MNGHVPLTSISLDAETAALIDEMAADRGEFVPREVAMAKLKRMRDKHDALCRE